MIEGVAITNGVITVRLPKPNRHCDCYIESLERKLAEAQKVEGTALEGRWYKHTDVYASDGESWKEKYEAALDTLARVESVAPRLAEIISEVTGAHSEPQDANYNNCETPDVECQWCFEAKQSIGELLKALEGEDNEIQS